MTHDLPTNLADIDFEFGDFSFLVPRSDQDLCACRDLTFERVRLPDYGCLRVDEYQARFADHTRDSYLAARNNPTHEMLGTYRVQPAYDLEAHQNLEDPTGLVDLEELFDAHHRVADLASFIRPVAGGMSQSTGAGVGPAISFTGRTGITFIGLFRLAVRFAYAGGIDAFYIQSRPQQVRTYGSIGFVPVGPEFKVEGWVGSWIPMLLRVDRIIAQHADRDYHRRHRDASGFRFRSGFWQYMLTDNLPSPNLLLA